MKLYRSRGSIWTGTQADAKAAQGGTDYETVEVPTDKPGLMAWLNAQTAPQDVLEAPAEPEDDMDDDEDLPTPKRSGGPLSPEYDAKGPGHPHNGFKHIAMEEQSGRCVRCGRTEAAYVSLQEGSTIDEITTAVLTLTKGYALNRVADAIEERAEELGLNPLDDG